MNDINKKPTAIVLTNGLLADSHAKTAHGLIRGTERFEIIGVIDPAFAGKDAGEVLDGKHRGIPVLESIEEAKAIFGKIDYCIIGIATIGGVLPPELLVLVKEAVSKGLSVVNGLHDFLNDKPELVKLATQNNAELIDIRRPKPREQLHFWTGEIFKMITPVVAVIGTDCAMGKRTTCRMIRQACETESINAQMIYTGQTGWVQGGKYGFVFDSTLNDFISGELEYAILSCNEAEQPDIILIEGQSALRNPSGPCGSEFLISGKAKHTVLVHAPKRKYYEELPLWGEIPSIESEIELIKMYGSKVIAVALNTEHCTYEEALDYQQKYETELGLPVLLPLQQGVNGILPEIKKIIASAK